MLTTEDLQAFKETAAELDIQNPQWLLDLVSFETGGTFNPQIKNPYSSARGLIQFIDSTARGLGYNDSLHLVSKFPTVQAQLAGPVTDYLRPYGPYNSAGELFLSVFYPAARNYSIDTTFEDIFKDRYDATWRTKYIAFRDANPRITTPRDYINLVQGHSKYNIESFFPYLVVALAGMLGYFIIQHRA